MKNTNSISSNWSLRRSPFVEVTSRERNQLVFEHLNKTYGAFEIRTNYDRTLQKTLAFSVLLILFISSFIFLTSKVKEKIIIPITEAVQIEYPPIIPQVVPEIPSIVSPPSGPPVTDAFLKPIITNDSIAENDSKPILVLNPGNPDGNPNDSNNTAIINTSGPKGGGGKYIEEADSTYDGPFIQEPPTFPGGDKALLGFLQKNTNYPEVVKEIGGKGIVGVSFVLDKEGNVTEVGLRNATKYIELNNEALRVVKKMPQWNPGKQQGRSVKVRMILPIRFELKQ